MGISERNMDCGKAGGTCRSGLEIRRLVLGVFTIGIVLVVCVLVPSQTSLIVATVILPAAAGAIARWWFRCEHEHAILVVLGCGVVFGATVLAYASFDQTFNKGATGFLVGGGWGSVKAAAIVGGFAGFLGGVVAALIYGLGVLLTGIKTG